MLEVFETKPYATIYIPKKLKQLIMINLELWREFCSLPDEFKEQLRLERHNTDWGDPGYRNKKQNLGDKKELFHYLLANKHFMFIDGVYHLAHSEPKAREFFSGADEILRAAIEMITGSYQLLGFNKSLLAEQAQFSTLRFLRYVAQEEGKEIADSHFDYSGLTLHLWPNNGELECLVNGIWQKFQTPVDHAALFPSVQSVFATQGRTDPIIHRAVQKQKGERLAVVAFIPYVFCQRFPKGKDHREWSRENGKGYLFEERVLEPVSAMAGD